MVFLLILVIRLYNQISRLVLFENGAILPQRFDRALLEHWATESVDILESTLVAETRVTCPDGKKPQRQSEG